MPSSQNRFDPASVTAFRFVSHDFDENSGTATFHYAFDDSHAFTERLIFPSPRLPLTMGRRQALALCLDYLHLMLGISYYKAAVPPAMVIGTRRISRQTARFFEKVYRHGLAEFAFRNHLDMARRIRFPFHRDVSDRPAQIALQPRDAIPVGGGKDSIVTVEALRSGRRAIVLVALGAFDAIEQVAQTAQLPLITVKRHICPTLFTLNQQGAYNGHVPISAIIAFVLPVCALLYGFDTAVMSNERSANVGNLVQNGFVINHQYSKGYEFELDVSAFFKNSMLKNFNYFSLLRPLSDLNIASAFAKLPAYHSIFKSCNTVFRLDVAKRRQNWCLNCPKCRFTFLALAPFMEKRRLLEVFGENLLNDPHQTQGYDELAGFGSYKPFECVGEINETQAAFYLLTNQANWCDDLLVRRFANDILPTLGEPDVLTADAFRFSQTHQLPQAYLEKLRAHLRT